MFLYAQKKSIWHFYFSQKPSFFAGSAELMSQINSNFAGALISIAAFTTLGPTVYFSGRLPGFITGLSFVTKPARVLLVQAGKLLDTVTGAMLATFYSRLSYHLTASEIQLFLQAMEFIGQQFMNFSDETFEKLYGSILRNYLTTSPSRYASVESLRLIQAIQSEGNYYTKLISLFSYIMEPKHIGRNLHQIICACSISFYQAHKDSVQLKTIEIPQTLQCALSGQLAFMPVRIPSEANGDGRIYSLISLCQYFRESERDTLIGCHGKAMVVDFNQLIPDKIVSQEVENYINSKFVPHENLIIRFNSASSEQVTHTKPGC